MDDVPSQREQLRSALGRACRAQSMRAITRGREEVLTLPRDWVIETIEVVAHETLDLSDYWEYQRLLELFDLVDAQLVRRLVSFGRNSHNAEVQEAAEDWFGPEPSST
jgi:hypothetical protein